MKDRLPIVSLSLEEDQSNLVAHLTFTNNTDHDIYLDQQTICFETELQRNLFLICNDRNRKIDYTGMMVKRDVEPEDFIVLPAGQKQDTSVIIDKGYELKRGKKYSIQYVAFNPSYLELQGLMKMESNKVEVSY